LHTYETGAQCVNCHGPDGSGGSAKFTVTDEDGNYVSTVQWTAPALNTLLYRFSKSEVRFILEYGRPGTPMAAWGVPGGGPLTSQTLDNVIEYLWSIQVTPDKMKADLDAVIKEFDSSLYDRVVANREKNAKVIDATSTDYTRMDLADELRLGEFLFYLNDGRVGGNAMSCARCHVSGASYGKPWKPISELARGRSAYDLTNVEKNLTEKQHFTLVNNGSEYGKLYGANSQGSGRMPGFGVNANNGTTDDVRKFGAAGMLTTEEVWAVVTYERHLATERAAIDAATAASETQNSEASK
jgi:mono/diheme cytochrome c family protein